MQFFFFQGTPVQNDLQEFYAIIEFVNPGILGSSTAYRKVYEEPILRSRQPSCTEVPHLLHMLSSFWGWILKTTHILIFFSPNWSQLHQEDRVLGEERAAELSRLTGMFILRRTQEIINRYLPPRLDWTLFCELSPLQRELYQQLLCHRVFRACLQGSTQTHTHLACITALKKLCNHPHLLHATVKVGSSTESGNSILTKQCLLTLTTNLLENFLDLVLQERADSGSVESSLYEGLVDLFPESYSSAGLDIADSGKLQVLSDLLTAVRQFGPSDRCVGVFV